MALISTPDNIAEMGTQEALTGPIARGDTEVIKRHLQALEGEKPELAGFYRAAGLWAVELAQGASALAPRKAEQLREILKAVPSTVAAKEQERAFESRQERPGR